MSTFLCPECKHELDVLLFMGIQPDFLTCPECEVAYSIPDSPEDDIDPRPVAQVI